MGASITIAGERLIAQKQADRQPLEVARFVLAYLPGLDTTQPVDRDAGLPPAEQIVYSVNISRDGSAGPNGELTREGYLSPNQVVYSLLMGTNIGDFDFNWIGLQTTEDVLLIAAYVPRQQKRRELPPLQTGNNLTRNIVLEYDGAQSLTGIEVPAASWQFDFTAQFAAMNTQIAALQAELEKKVDAASWNPPQSVSLDGPVLVYPGSSNTYQITDFDAFAVYQASSTVGSVTLAGDEMTLDIPIDAPPGLAALEVRRNEAKAVFKVPVGSAAIEQPAVIAPADGATGVTFEPELQATTFTVYPAGHDQHVETRWQIARDTAFTQLVFDQQGADDLTAVSLAAAGVRLDPSTRYYVRAQYHGATLVSTWSAAVAFNTATIYIRKPTITSPLDGADRVSPGLTVTADAFSVSGGSDAHDSSRWQVSTVADFSSVIVDSGWSASHLTSFKPSGLSRSTAYFVRVKYRGAQVGESEWSSVIGFVTASQLQGVYTQLTGGATGRTNAAMAVLGRRMYVAGGQPGQNTFWEYDLDTAIWKQLPTPPWGGRYGATLAVVGSKLYLYGGYTGSYQDITYSDLWCYDTVSAVWSQLPSSANARHGARASVIDQRIYIIGGSKGSSLNYADLQIYDIPTSKWLTGQAALQTRSYHAQGVIGGKIYIHGGRAAGNNDTTECYDPSTNQWTAKAPASLAVQLQRHGTAFAVIDEKLYIFGGYTGSYLNVYFNDLYVYDPGPDVWQALPPGASKVDGACGVSVDGKMLIFGGAIASSIYSNSLWSIS